MSVMSLGNTENEYLALRQEIDNKMENLKTQSSIADVAEKLREAQELVRTIFC